MGRAVQHLLVTSGILSTVLSAGFAQVGGQFVGLDVRKVVFKTDHNVLRDYWTNYEGDGSSLFPLRGWEWYGTGEQPYVSYPVSHTKNTECKINVTYRVGPAGYEHFLEGFQSPPTDYLYFFKSGLTSTGDTLTTTEMTKSTPMINRIAVLPYTMIWKSGTQPGNFTDDKMVGHNIYVTWSTPFGSAPTYRRMHWVCSAAHWADTIEAAADGIWNALGDVDPPYEPGQRPLEEGATWKLLDGNVSGECDEQAMLMKLALNMLGISATVELIRASTDTDVLDLESQKMVDSNGDERPAFLVMDFDTGPGYNWNAFEACCVVDGKWYAVWPKWKALSALQMYRDLGFEQYWVFTVDDTAPTNPGWEVEEIVPGTGPVPKA